MVDADVFLGVSAKAPGDAGDGRLDGREPGDLRDGEPGPGDHAGRGPCRARRCVRGDRALGLSNQVNNVLGFPYLFRGALDVYPRDQRRDEDRCARALAKLAREDVPDEVDNHGRKLSFGRDYIIPTPFDPRLILALDPARRGQGRDGYRCRTPPDHRHEIL